MKEKAKEILLKLKEKNKVLSDSIDDYVKAVAKELEISDEIASRLVMTEIVNKNQKQLILSQLFSPSTLNEVDLEI